MSLYSNTHKWSVDENVVMTELWEPKPVFPLGALSVRTNPVFTVTSQDITTVKSENWLYIVRNLRGEGTGKDHNNQDKEKNLKIDSDCIGLGKCKCVRVCSYIYICINCMQNCIVSLIISYAEHTKMLVIIVIGQSQPSPTVSLQIILRV